jgi:hypothetical protein
MYWRLSESFKARLWNERRSVKELEAELVETQKRAVLVKQAREGMPTNTGGFAGRVSAVRGAHGSLAAAPRRRCRRKQANYLQDSPSANSRPEAAHRDLSDPGALRTGGDLRQDHGQGEGEAQAEGALHEAPAPAKASRVLGCARGVSVTAVGGGAGLCRSKNPPTIKDLEGQQVDVNTAPPQGVDAEQDHGQLQALPRSERRRCGAARRSACAAWAT